MNTARALLLVLLICPAAALPQAPPPFLTDATDGPGASSKASWQVGLYYASGQFAALDAIIDKYSSSDQVLDDGTWSIAGVLSDQMEFFTAYHLWDLELKKIAEWRKERPDSYAADVYEAILYRAWAWAARGTGYANTVAPEGWKLFNERLQHAEQILRQSKAGASKTPLYYQLYLDIARELGWSHAAYQQLFDEALQRFPGYQPLYFSTTFYLSPQWGGTYAEIDQLARNSFKTTNGVTDHSMYARVYWYLSQEQGDEFNPFEDSLASWPLMKQGFSDLMKQYPKSKWNLNAFASFACRANDAATYWKTRQQIGNLIYTPAWPSNHSVEVCDAHLTKSV